MKRDVGGEQLILSHALQSSVGFVSQVSQAGGRGEGDGEEGGESLFGFLREKAGNSVSERVAGGEPILFRPSQGEDYSASGESGDSCDGSSVITSESEEESGESDLESDEFDEESDESDEESDEFDEEGDKSDEDIGSYDGDSSMKIGGDHFPTMNKILPNADSMKNNSSDCVQKSSSDSMKQYAAGNMTIPSIRSSSREKTTSYDVEREIASSISGGGSTKHVNVQQEITSISPIPRKRRRLLASCSEDARPSASPSRSTNTEADPLRSAASVSCSHEESGKTYDSTLDEGGNSRFDEKGEVGEKSVKLGAGMSEQISEKTATRSSRKRGEKTRIVGGKRTKSTDSGEDSGGDTGEENGGRKEEDSMNMIHRDPKWTSGGASNKAQALIHNNMALNSTSDSIKDDALFSTSDVVNKSNYTTATSSNCNDKKRRRLLTSSNCNDKKSASTSSNCNDKKSASTSSNCNDKKSASTSSNCNDKKSASTSSNCNDTKNSSADNSPRNNSQGEVLPATGPQTSSLIGDSSEEIQRNPKFAKKKT